METMRLYKKYYIECYATEKEPLTTKEIQQPDWITFRVIESKSFANDSKWIDTVKENPKALNIAELTLFVENNIMHCTKLCCTSRYPRKKHSWLEKLFLAK